MNEIMFTITDENEENMKLLVRVMRKADWMLSVSSAFTAQKIANEMFLLPNEGQKENVYDILNWLVKIGELRLAHGVYDVPPCERVYIK